MKQILLATLCALAVLTSCKKSKDNQGEAITFKRADISGAKFLTLAGGSDGKATPETKTLYKIDENGNMTAVVFYIQTGQDGDSSIENVSEDIKVIPERIFDYGKGYMLFYWCSVESITDKYRGIVYKTWGDRSPSFLVRKSDGAIFEIGRDQIDYFPYDDNREDVDFIRDRKLTYNSRGELYMAGGRYENRNVSKLRVENEKLLLQQITTGVYAATIVLDKNDNLFVSEDWGRGNIFYCRDGYIYSANGSVVAFEGGYDDHRRILLIDNEYYIIDRSSEGKNYDRIYTYTLKKISSLASDIAFTDVATLTTKESMSSWDLAIETESNVIFCYSYGGALRLVYTKSTQKLSIDPLPDGFEKNSFNQEGIAYEYSEQNCTQITKYNIVDKSKKTINCDRSAVPPFIQTETKETSTDFFESGVKSSNGAPIRVQTNLETGKVTVYEDVDGRKITELIKVS